MWGLSEHLLYLLYAQKQGKWCTEQAMGLENGSQSMPWGLSGHSECAQKQ